MRRGPFMTGDTPAAVFRMAKEGSISKFLETLAVAAYLFVAFGLGVLTILFMIGLGYSSKIGLIFVTSWCIWIYLDRDIHEKGGRRMEGFRNLAWWRYHRTYFPVNLHKAADLPNNRNYLFAVFPHGVLSAGAFSAFGTNAHKNVFPGITIHLVTLRVLFYIPLLRDLLLASGCISSTNKSLNWVLGSPGTGKAAVLVVGGAGEAAYSQPGVYKIMLRHRRGFCRLALQNGASLVPVLSLGEVDLFDVISPLSGTWMSSLQKWVKDTTGILPVRFIGTGWFGLLPRREPLNVIVGAPIHVEKTTEISEKLVDELREEFEAALVKLFHDNKHYLRNPDSELLFV